MADQAHQLMALEGGEIAREYRKGNWTLQETMVLIEAKRMDKERRTKRGSGTGGGSAAAGGGRPSELRWKWVEDYCWRHGCHRSQNQCNDKWDNLMRDYKKVRNYEEKVAGAGGEGSYWKLESHERKERNLPSNFLPQVYEALYDVVERRGSAGGGGGSAHGVEFAAAAAEERLLGGVSSTSLPPLLVQQLPSAPAQELPSLQPPPIISAPPPPPPPPQQSLPHPQVLHELDSDDTEHSSSPPTKRMRGGRRDHESSSAAGRSSHELLGSAISKGAAMLAEALMANEEREETRHRDLLILKERKLKMEQSRAETSAEAMAGLVTAINRLASSIQESVPPHRDPRAPE